MEKVNNSKFYEAMNAYYDSHRKKDWDTMFLEVVNICQGIVTKMASRCKGMYSAEDVYTFAVDSACKVMEKLRDRELRIKNITNYCWLWCKAMFTTYPMLKQAQFEKNVLYFSNNIYEKYVANDSLFERLE